jgi:integrase
MTISDHIKSFLSAPPQRRGGEKKINTIISYQDTFRGFEAIYGQRQPENITPAEIRQYLLAMPVSAGTKAVRYATLKALFNHALRGIEQAGEQPDWRNPCNTIAADFPQPKRNGEPLSDTIHEDMQAVSASLQGKHRLIFELGSRAGLRVSEILGIRPSDLIRQGKACLVMVASKKGANHDNRVIPPDLCDSLRAYIEERRIRDDERVFGITRQTVYAVFKARGIEPHDLRRYFAFKLMEMRKPLKVISQALDHSSLATTERYIKNLSVARLAQELEGI